MLNIFISWSGITGKQIAEKLKYLMVNVMQFADGEVFLAPADISKGKAWRDELRTRLLESNSGIFILTPDTKPSEWMAFEAGAVSTKAGQKCLIPLLFGTSEGTIPKYLTEYQFANFHKEDYKDVFSSLGMTDKLSQERIDCFWELFEPHCSRVVEDASKKAIELEERLRNDPDQHNEWQELLKVASSIQELAELPREISGVKSEIFALSQKIDSFQWRLTPSLQENGLISSEPASMPSNPNRLNLRNASTARLNSIVRQIEEYGLLDEATLKELKSATEDVIRQIY